MEERVSLILVTVFYLVVFLCGLVGNLLVCIVIARSKCLHSAMNYYLISLALADLILLILGKKKLGIFSNITLAECFSTTAEWLELLKGSSVYFTQI